jgi:hypothetical protein
MIRKIFLPIIVLLIVFYAVLLFFGRNEHDVAWGISFNQNHAADLGLNWEQVYLDMLYELEPDYVRIAAMWDDVEAVKGEYDFSRVDWMMDKAFEANAKVTLVVGQKAPRWPECHIPEWNDYSVSESKDHLLDYVRATVARYKDHPALEVWQVENEPFIRFAFGECEGYNEEAIYEEIAIVRELDPERKILVTDSGELGIWKDAAAAGDYFGTTLYRVVRTPKGFVIKYDAIPAGFYTLKAKVLKIDLDRLWVAELQAEPWFTDSDPTNTPLEIMAETMTFDRMQRHINYTARIGTNRAYLWGVEWWYFMRQKHDDARYWEVAKNAILNGKQNTPE